MRDEVVNFANSVRSDINEHLILLFDIVARVKPAEVIECGIRHGNSAYALRRAARTISAHYTGIDIDKNCKKALDKDPISGLTETFVAQHDCVWAVNNEGKTWNAFVMIDTSHELEHTLAELRIFRHAQVICLHDSNNPRFQVAEALEVFFKLDPIDWGEDFNLTVGDWEISHFAKNNGMTIMEMV